MSFYDLLREENKEEILELTLSVKLNRDTEEFKNYREYLVDSMHNREKNYPMKFLMDIHYDELDGVDSPNPTRVQKILQNYLRPRVYLYGRSIELENLAGSFRKGVNEETGELWRNKLLDHYGFFTNTIGEDNEEIDVWLNAKATALEIETRPIFAIKQYFRDGSFDEYKVILGALSASHAKRIYTRNYRNIDYDIEVVTIPSLERFLNKIV